MQWTDDQAEAIKLAVAGKDVAIKGGHGTGKTTVLAACMVRVMQGHDGVGVLMAAPFSGLISDVLLDEVRRQLRDARGHIHGNKVHIGSSLAVRQRPHYSNQYPVPDTLMARTRYVLVVECAEAVSPRVLIDLEDKVGLVQVVMTGCPLAKTGLLWHAFRWHRLSYSAADHPRVANEFVARVGQQFGEDSDVFRARILGEFST